MRFDLSSLAAAASLLAATSRALTPPGMGADVPVQALLTSAQTHLARGETSEALAFYDAAVARDPTNYLTLFKRATTHLSLGRTARATDDFNRVLALQPGFEGAHVQLARIKSRAADWAAARAEYAAAGRAAAEPDLAALADAERAAALAAAAERAAQWDDCVNHAAAAILVASRSPALRSLRARCRFERGDVEEALGDLQHVVQMRPGDTAPHVLLAATAFYALADLDAGLAHVRKCLHSDPDSNVCGRLHKQQKRLHAAYARARAQLDKGQTTTAGRALAGTPDAPGLVATIRTQVDELREAGSIPPKARARLYESVVDMACQAYLESNHKEAPRYCDEALQLDPDSFWALVYRAKSLLNDDQFEAAIQTLEKAAQLRPDKQDKVNPLLNKARIALKRSKTKDYYKVLGVPSDADQRQIKSAYRKASKQYHPDKAAVKGITKDQAEKKMASINEAYEVLSDPELRARFDRGDDPNSQDTASPFHSPFGDFQHMFHQQGGGGGQANFKFHFGGGAGGPFGF